MEQDSAVQCLAALAHSGRLSLMRRLVKAGPSGLSSGKLAEMEKIKASTASAQLLVLSQCGLINSERNGKHMIYRARFERFQQLMTFLIEDCCAGYQDEP